MSSEENNEFWAKQRVLKDRGVPEGTTSSEETTRRNKDFLKKQLEAVVSSRCFRRSLLSPLLQEVVDTHDVEISGQSKELFCTNVRRFPYNIAILIVFPPRCIKWNDWKSKILVEPSPGSQADYIQNYRHCHSQLKCCQAIRVTLKTLVSNELIRCLTVLSECCCRHKKPTVPSDSDISANGYSTSDSATPNSPVGQQSIPQINYDEIDPPPSYAALFPNQKITTESNDISSNGLSSSATGDGPPTALQPTD